MPLVTSFIDDLRGAFGCDEIDEAIRRGLRGEGVFWASEGGVEVGSCGERRNEVKGSDLVLSHFHEVEDKRGRKKR